MDDKQQVEYGRLAVELWRACDHPGGMDWIYAVAKKLYEREAGLRASIENAEAALRFYADPDNYFYDGHGLGAPAEIDGGKKARKALADKDAK